MVYYSTMKRDFLAVEENISNILGIQALLYHQTYRRCIFKKKIPSLRRGGTPRCQKSEGWEGSRL